MKIKNIVAKVIVVTVFAWMPSLTFAQITSIANAVVPTEYAVSNQDAIHVFCGKRGETNASLIATSPSGEPSRFEWQKYNPATGNFDLFQSDLAGNTTSTISNLQDGAYRVNITSTSGLRTFTAWVFNNYIETKAEITDSNCNSFILRGSQESPVFSYTDLSNGQPKTLNKGTQTKWTTGPELISSVITYQVFNPPTKNTDYTLTVTDRFGCQSQAVVKYISIVTKASFTYQLEDQKKSHPSKREAPLPVVFTNTSENADASKYEWFIFKSREDIIKEREANPTAVIDSFLTKIYTESPIYTFEKPGSYNVKLVAKNSTCTDTIYIDEFIVIDESFLEAPNFFTPNGDEANQEFVIRFFSMKSVKISIFNRWGKMVHEWESNNVQGFGPTLESDPQSVWNGKVGGKVATPGVYYYVVDGIGRDDKRRKTGGFVHLFRDK